MHRWVRPGCKVFYIKWATTNGGNPIAGEIDLPSNVPWFGGAAVNKVQLGWASSFIHGVSFATAMRRKACLPRNTAAPEPGRSQYRDVGHTRLPGQRGTSLYAPVIGWGNWSGRVDYWALDSIQ